MTRLRVGTRGSDLALWQTRWVCERLRRAHPVLGIDEVIIKTHGDVAADAPLAAGTLPGAPGRSESVGWFVSAIEQALSERRVDFAVHSFKDLQSAATPGLVIAAVPRREVVHDVLVTREPVDLDDLPAGFRVGTSSPRRAAQFRRVGNVAIVPIRGNVPTRVAKIEGPDYDGVVLAAAGLKRLGIEPPNRIDLPTDRFVPAPAQGALAVQAREGEEAARLVGALDDPDARRAVSAERAFLRGVSAGCQTPVAALATVAGRSVSLHGQLFSDDHERLAEGVETGDDPEQVGRRLADRLLRELKSRL